MRPILVLATAAVLLAVGLPGAHAGTGLYTADDAQALLYTYPRSEDVFSRISPRASLDVRPFQFYGDLPYCVGDWHVLALAWWEAEYSVPDVPLHTNHDVKASLRALEAHFFLDGVSIDVVRTLIAQVDKNIAETERANVEAQLAEQYGDGVGTAGKVWGFQWGRILAPGELPVGMHTLEVQVASGPGVPFQGNVTFEVSPPNSPVCTV